MPINLMARTGMTAVLMEKHYYDNSTFKQLIDHNNPNLGTFDQFYYYDTTYWRGPGSPVILFSPGEVNATMYHSFLTPSHATGALAEQIGAATIVLEHRYWGDSTPFRNFTTENLKYLTVENSMKDITYFARQVQLPFATDERIGSSAKDVPWVAIGGSYFAALLVWIASLDPGTIWAYYASSASVQSVSDYWAYFLPIQEAMPKNCSRDISLVIDHMDDILSAGSRDEQHELKAKFGMQDVAHNDDFMNALARGPYLWLGNQFTYNTGFFTFCDYIENAVNATLNDLPSEAGVGVDKALEGYAEWWREVELPGYCAGDLYPEFNTTGNTDCFNTYNASSPLFTDTTPRNAMNRQWFWMNCNEPFGNWKVGAPSGRPSLISRLITTDYWVRQCGLYFPPGPNGETYGLAAGRTEEHFNTYFGGWNITNTSRLIFVNGEFDPWREISVSAKGRPGGPLQSTEQVPVEIVPDGVHTSDLNTKNGKVNAGVKEVQDRVLKQLVGWVEEWPGEAT
ncbi:hypothetical protein J4E80_000603 [Alternaria sp. BMP 0032]|nr:hypothetical protein J4E80_000603 [Alternaria sp. BMP 0032]